MSQLFWELAYALGVSPWDTGQVPPELVRAVNDGTIRASSRALDLGCGTGTNVVFLAQQGCDVVGVDVSRLAIRRAKARLRHTGVSARLHAYDVTRLHLPESPVEAPFSFVLDIGCFHGLDELQRARYVPMLRELLQPEGHALQYIHVTGGVSVGGSGKRPTPRRGRFIMTLLRTITRRNRPQRPDLEEVVGMFEPFCELINVGRGQDAGRASAWLLWRRKDTVR